MYIVGKNLLQIFIKDIETSFDITFEISASNPKSKMTITACHKKNRCNQPVCLAYLAL